MDHSTQRSGRRALLIAADQYTDPGLGQLRSPAQDVQNLAEVLADPAIGAFSVNVLRNKAAHEIESAIEDFFADALPTDVLLLYFSCHGWKDEAGRLFFATTGTRLDRPNSSAVPSSFVNEQLECSMSRKVVVLLDCCYSGAFTRGLRHRGGSSVNVTAGFAGSGSAVICSSTALEYSFEADHGTLTLDPSATMPAPRASVFTGAVIDGLRSGDADLNGDGRVSIDELYDYVYERIVTTVPNQKPTKFMDVQGELTLATSPRGVRPKALPPEVLQALESPLPSVRSGGVEALRRLALPGDGQGTLARDRLVAMADDDSRQVAAQARAALAEAGRNAGTPPAPPSVPPPPFAPAQPFAPPPRQDPSQGSPGSAVGAYLLPFFTSLFLIRSADRDTRFHAWQCVFIDVFTIVTGVGLACVDIAYLGIRYGSSEPQEDDPFALIFALSLFVVPCVLRLHCLIMLGRRRRPRLPVMGPIAESIAYHGVQRG